MKMTDANFKKIESFFYHNDRVVLMHNAVTGEYGFYVDNLHSKLHGQFIHGFTSKRSVTLTAIRLVTRANRRGM